MVRLPTTLVLSQSYHPGWTAWVGKPFIGKKLDHVLVNNWENGWRLNLKSQISNVKTTTKISEASNPKNQSTIKQYDNIFILLAADFGIPRFWFAFGSIGA